MKNAPQGASYGRTSPFLRCPLQSLQFILLRGLAESSGLNASPSRIPSDPIGLLCLLLRRVVAVFRKRPFIDSGKVIGHFDDAIPQLQWCQPTLRDLMDSQHGTQQVSRDRPGGVTITGDVHGPDNTILEVLGGQGAVEPYPQGLLCHPALAKAGQSLIVRAFPAGQVYGPLNGSKRLLVPRLSLEDGIGLTDGLSEAGAPHELVDEHGHDPPAGSWPVG